MQPKICTLCDKELKVDKFYKSKDKIFARCILCTKLKNKEFYLKNHESIKLKDNLYRKEYRKNNPEKCREQHNRSSLKSKEEHMEAFLLQTAKRRSKILGLKFELIVSDIK